MAQNDWTPGSRPAFPDELTSDQVRRFQLWRALTDLTKAQADGRLTEEQARMLESLAENLQRLAVQLGQFAELGQQCVQILDPERTSANPAQGSDNEL